MHRNDSQYFPKIKLSDSNTCDVNFPDGTSHRALFDSGSRRSLISSSLVSQIPYLLTLPRHSLSEPIKLMVGNGSFVSTFQFIEPQISVDSVLLPTKLYIVPNFTTYAIILGVDTQKKYKALLDTSTNELLLRRPFYPIKVLRKTVLQPGQLKSVKVYSPLPHSHKDHSLVVATLTKYQPYSPHEALYQFKRGRSNILLKNPTKNTVHLYPKMQVASVCLNDKVELSTPIVDLGPEAVPPYPRDRADQSKMTLNELSQYKQKLYPFLSEDDPRLQKTDEQLIREQINLEHSKLSADGKKRLHQILLHNKEALALHDQTGKVFRYKARIIPEFADKSGG